MNESSYITTFVSPIEGGKIRCDICPRYCVLGKGQRGLCFVRKNMDGKLVLTTYGRSSGIAIDPIEKKPLYHYYPGSSVLSFGTAGCNLTCKFCQNWDMSKSRQMDILQVSASPEQIAQSAVKNGCKSVAFTYNDPVIFMEYAIDTAIACHELGIKTVAVTAGYINPEPAIEFFKHMDAVNVDLKGFTNGFYQKLCSAHIQPVLDTLAYIGNETDCWLEITNLLIPGYNDSTTEITLLCEWVVNTLGDTLPVHFSAFHPAYKMMDVPHTSTETMMNAQQIAKSTGLKHVYLGNVRTPSGQNTKCVNCGKVLVLREGYRTQIIGLENGQCVECSTRCNGIWD